ncbi:MAG: helix-turn-helix domain-containing protein [Actinomycetota bacterium]|nr:helix-turn-helix domain-containing protein [Actinomycetota bacterium]
MQLKTPADLAALVRDRRRALGWTQHHLAAECGTSVRWVVDLEAGKPSVQTGMVLVVLATLGVTLEVRATDDAAGARLDAYLEQFADGN